MAAAGYPPFIDNLDANDLDDAFKVIAQALVDGGAQFLFGAGMSRDSDVPVGFELGMALLDEFFPKSSSGAVPDADRLKDLAGEFPFEAIVHAVEQKRGRVELTRILKRILVDPHPKPNAGHFAFLSLLGVPPRVRQIFTTNYDTLLEDALGPDLAVPITEKNATSVGRAEGKLPIIYLRGKLDNDDYRITEPQYSTNNFSLLMEEFKTALHHATAFVFVGFSLNDMDFRQFYLNFLEQLKSRKIKGKTTYFVSPAKDSFSYTLGTAIWKLREAMWIPMYAEVFFTKLKDVVENQALDTIRSEVKRKYGVMKEAEYDDLVKRTAELWRMNAQDALVFLYEARTRIGGEK
ncbi:MAG: SIR2 family protein [Verrucomicrobiota bacterium]|jgi:hypothetical protein